MPALSTDEAVHAAVQQASADIHSLNKMVQSQRETIRALFALLFAQGVLKDPSGEKLRYLREGGHLTMKLTDKGFRVETNLDRTGHPQTIWDHIDET